MEFPLFLSLSASLLLAAGIGASDTADAMGTAVGARILSYRKAVLLFSFFLFLGAIIEGGKVVEPVGRGVVSGPFFSDHPLPLSLVLLLSGLAVMVSAWYGIPLSTHQVILGGIIGGGMIGHLLLGSSEVGLRGVKVLQILLAWCFAPLLSLFLSFSFYRLFRRFFLSVKNPATLNFLFSLGVVSSGCYMAYVMGANGLGTIMGGFLATRKGELTPSFLHEMALGGALLAVAGAFTLGERVVRTVGSGLAPLSPTSAIASQLGASLSVHFFTQYGLPVSMSHAIVTSVVGAGLAMDVSMVRGGKVRELMAVWVLCPLLTFVAGSLLYLLYLH
ncbi:MAG: inorganic phosphate transporter [Candidatus Hadarchaeales archaeon]